jgi:pimeloyl-ACP methyl ester carboxylesterase
MSRAKKPSNHVDDLRGATRLAIAATRSVTDLVEAMHRNIGGGPALLGSPLLGPVRLLTGPIYASIRGVTTLVGASIDGALAQLLPLAARDDAGARAPELEALLAVLNGVLGDYLSATANPLALEMQLRQEGRPLELARQTGRKLVVLVHGSCRNDRQWLSKGHDHGAALVRDLGFTSIQLLYNSGLHISTNGQGLARILEEMIAGWPVPVEELVIIGHSMGGLLARSACHAGERAGHRWRRQLSKLVCLGSPHHGAALERGGNIVDVLLGVSRYSAPLARLGKIRSAGVTDLRYGLILDEHWQGRDRFAPGGDPRCAVALPEGVACYAIAATTAPAPADATAKAKARKLPGDGLVSIASALGRHEKPALTLAFPEAHQSIAYGMGHLDLIDRPEVYETLRRWLA